MSVYVQTNQPVQLPNADYQILAADSGKLMLVGVVPLTTGARTYTLPAPAAGLHYRFQNATAGALGQNALIAGGAALSALMNGALTIVGANPVAVSGRTSVNFLTAATLHGDSIDCYCDGTRWSVLGFGQVAGSLGSTA